MLNFFIGFAFFEAGAIFGFFVAALLNAAHAGQESTIFEENDTMPPPVRAQRRRPQAAKRHPTVHLLPGLAWNRP